jgi:hypothetical protein
MLIKKNVNWYEATTDRAAPESEQFDSSDDRALTLVSKMDRFEKNQFNHI